MNDRKKARPRRARPLLVVAATVAASAAACDNPPNQTFPPCGNAAICDAGVYDFTTPNRDIGNALPDLFTPSPDNGNPLPDIGPSNPVDAGEPADLSSVDGK